MRRKKNNFPAKYVLLIMVVLCLVIIGCSVRFSLSDTPANAAVGYVIVPMQKGINRAGIFLTDVRSHFTSMKKLSEENDALKEELADVSEELDRAQANRKELEQLRELYDMDKTWSDYEKAAANVVAKDAGNWFSTFVVDRGSKDGVAQDMNVVSDGGLVGVVTEVGPNYATVRSIVDDNSNVSCRDLNTGDLMIVSGSLKSMDEGNLILFSDLKDSDDVASSGDQVVTSDISDLYLPGIPVGYITQVGLDSNKLTKSGSLVTTVDFRHLEKVFVILQTKTSLTQDGGE